MARTCLSSINVLLLLLLPSWLTTTTVIVVAKVVEEDSRGQSRHGEKYNVLLISVDDLRPEFGKTYGGANSEILSPNIDRLLAKSVDGKHGSTVFHKAFCQIPTCGSSRSSMLTGRRPDTTQVLSNKMCFRDGLGNHKNWISLPHAFRKQGYLTAGSGKLFHDGVCDGKEFGEEKEAWSPELLPYFHCECLTSYYDGHCQSGASHKKLKKKQGHSKSGLKSLYANKTMTDDDMCDGKVMKSALKQLDTLHQKYEKTGQNFFLSVGLRKPHLPHIAPQKYFDLYGDLEQVSLPPNPSVPKNFPPEAWNPSGEFLTWKDAKQCAESSGYDINTPLNPMDTKAHRRGYFAAVSFVDTMIGHILSKLDSIPLLDENTIVVLWGDHGWQLGDSNEWGKHTMFTRSNRIPLIVRMPQPKKAQEEQTSSTPKTNNHHGYVEAVDLYPTLLDLAGLQVPPTCKNAKEALSHPQCMEGTSLASIVRGGGGDDGDSNAATSSPKQIQAAFSQWPMPGDKKYMGYSVWTDIDGKSYRYTEWVKYRCLHWRAPPADSGCRARDYRPKWRKLKAAELYDLTADPDERENLAGRGGDKHKDLRRKLQDILHNGWRGYDEKNLNKSKHGKLRG